MPWEYIKARLNTSNTETNTLRAQIIDEEKEQGWIDGEWVDNRRWVDTNELDYELVNVVTTEDGKHVGVFKKHVD